MTTDKSGEKSRVAPEVHDAALEGHPSCYMEEADRENSEIDPRILLAAERTLLAWIRTGLAMMGFGFVVAKFGMFMRQFLLVSGGKPPPSTGFSWLAGTVLIVIGVSVNFLAAWEYRAFRQWAEGKRRTRPDQGRVAQALAAVVGLLGLFMALYLVTVKDS